MKNVLQIMDYAAPYQGNFIPSLNVLEEHLAPQGGGMVYLFPDVAQDMLWAKELQKCHKVYFISRDFFSRRISYELISYIRHIVESECISVIHTHFIQANYNLYVYKVLYGKNIRFVTNVHNHYLSRGRLWWLKDWVYKHTYNLYIGDSQSTADSVLPLGVPREKTIECRNAINFARLDDFTLQDFAESGKYTYTLLMFGYPWYRKGVDIVARAVEQLNQSVSVRLLLAQSGGHDVTLEAIRETLGTLPEWVQMLPPTEQLSDYYNSVDAFVSAGREEGLSYSPIEAAYCACDVICSNIQGNPLDIQQIGIYETEDVDMLAKMLQERLTISLEEKESRKKVQRAYVLDAYDIHEWANKVINCY